MRWWPAAVTRRHCVPGGPAMPAVVVDRIIADGDALRLGDTTLTAHITPGHTKGCTTWTTNVTEKGRAHSVVFYCSTSVVDRLVGNTQYPQIARDYEHTFRKLRALSSDVFLAPHPFFFGLEEKRKRMTEAASNPFVDATELPRFVEKSERRVPHRTRQGTIPTLIRSFSDRDSGSPTAREK